MKASYAALFIALCALAVNAQPPIARNPIVTIEGKVQKVQLVPGHGMAYLEIQPSSGGEVARVDLGPMRFLMEQNFNPKAGAEVVVKGYKLTASVVAISVTLPAENRTIKLRDENGYPVWRGRMMMRRGSENR